MENGVYEEKAYENLGQRLRLPVYVKLGGLLSQNVRKGSKDLLLVLNQEAKNAFEERKSQARRYGEEAGTKLLLPMVMMLSVVMILIIIPAFLSYQIQQMTPIGLSADRKKERGDLDEPYQGFDF